MFKNIINKIRRANTRVERTMFEAKVLNLYTKEIETVVTDSKGLSNIIVHGFDIIEVKEV